MTVPVQSTETVINLGGLASLGPFATGFYYAQASDVEVWLYLPGEEPQLLAINVNYTLVGVSPLTAGGTVTLSAALLATYGATWPNGALLGILRGTATGQPSAFGEGFGFSPASSEAALDVLARQVQELKTLAQRLLAGWPGETLNPLPAALDRANGVLAFDANGQPIVLPASTSQAAASGATLIIPNTTYSPDTSAVAPTLNLGALALFGEGNWVEVADPMNNAAANNITILAIGADQINDHGVVESNSVITNSNTITRYTKRNGFWRVMQYGG